MVNYSPLNNNILQSSCIREKRNLGLETRDETVKQMLQDNPESENVMRIMRSSVK